MSEQRKSIELTKQGRRFLARAATCGIVALAGTPFVANAVVGSEKPQPVAATVAGDPPAPTLYKAMDAGIAREIPKGPEPEDKILAERTIQTGDSITGIMIDVDPSTDYRNSSSIVQQKATIASNDTREMYYGADETSSEDAVVWEDAALSREFGQRVVLAIPKNQIEQP